MADWRITGYFLSLLSILSQITATTSPSDSVCDGWAHLAQRLTGEGRIQVCAINQTNQCTRLDCEGTLKISHLSVGILKSKSISFDYCFGTRLNSCSEPVSMDFYLQLPGQNFTWKENIEHNEIVPLKDLKIPFGEMGKASPVFLFGIEKKENNLVAFSVTMKVEIEIVGVTTFLPQLESTLMNETAFPAESCTKPQKAATEFLLGTCHAKESPAESTQVVTSTEAPTPKPAIKKSATLNKECSLVTKPCSKGEICDHVQSKNICQCGPDYHLSQKKEACITYSKIGHSCDSKADCGYYEKCDKSDTASNHLICQCSNGYQYNPQRELCVIHFHGSDVSTEAATHSDASTTDNDTVTSNKEVSSAGTNKYVIIGVSVGGVVLLASVLIGFICHRRCRRMIRFDLYDNGDSPLLSNMGDDDDVNIII